MSKEKEYMSLAIDLAKKGLGFVNPNPLVGAVIVKNNKIIGTGYHERYGELHAERNALASLSEPADGADIYVTLEPCCHMGKQPPCTEAIIKSGIKRVFVGSKDPNPLVGGKGIEILRQNGIEVIENVVKDECDSLNKSFFHYITTKTPYVIAKYAMTFDGKTASFTGDSKWITNESSRQNVHLTRKSVAGIMVGIGTVLADDPTLNCRTENPKNPARIILDSRLRIPMDCNIVKTAKSIPTYIACLEAQGEKAERLRAMGITLLQVPSNNGQIDLKALMTVLACLKIDSLLIEGGGEVLFSAFESGIVNLVQCYIAPKILGGQEAKTPVGGSGIPLVSSSIMLSKPKITCFDNDILLEAEVI